MRMVGLAFAAVVSALAAQPANATPASLHEARPALWVVNDIDTTIYLFGTFHALDGRAAWFNDGVRTAFVASDELVLETLLPEKVEPVRHRPNVQSFASAPIKPGASFLASTRFAVSAGRSRGLTFDKGADAILRQKAREAGKKVSGIESFQFQLQMFERMPAAPVQAPVAGQKLDVHDQMASVMSLMQEAWTRGDGEIFADMLEGMRKNSPDTYRLLFVERNQRWAQWIAQRLEQPGTVFLAVGTGHLAGPDSLQNKLAQLGVSSARIN